MSKNFVPFNNPWAVDLIGNIASVTVGGTPRTSVDKYWDDGDVPWMASGDVHLREIADVPGRITELGLRYSNATMVDPPAVAIGLAGQGRTRGTVALVLCRLCTNQSVALIKSDREVLETRYLLYNLEFRYEELRSRSAGGGRAGLSKQLLEQVPIALPIPSEQTKIAEILSTVDRAIDQTEALIAKQQRIKTGLMQDLLTRGIDEHGNLRSEQTHKFKDSPLGRIPAEWDVAPIGTYGSKDRPCLRTGPFGTALNTRHWVEDGVPVLTIGSLGEGVVIESELLHVARETAEALEGFRVRIGDIVFSRVADIGRCLVIQEGQEGWIISSNLMKIAVDGTLARPSFLYRNIAFNSAIRKQLRLTANSGGRDLVNGPILSGLLFPWPGVKEQDRINDLLDSMEAVLHACNQQLAKSISLKTSLMQDLLTGEKRVTALL